MQISQKSSFRQEWTHGIRLQDENRENDYFSPDEVDGFYDLGYVEPPMLLLERFGIAFKRCEMEYDNDGEPICDVCLAA